MRLIALLIITLTFGTLPAFAQSESGRLVCFQQKGLEHVLGHVVNQMQFLNNSYGQTIAPQDINNQGCDFSTKQLHAGIFQGFYQNSHGFIFPIFRVRNGRGGVLMYAADGVFRSSSWYTSTLCGQGINTATTQCLLPRNCEVMRGFLNVSGNFLPVYMGYLQGCGYQRR